jgi:hypothetical protein
METNKEIADRIAQQWLNNHLAGTAACSSGPSINAINAALPKLSEAIEAALDEKGN